MTMSMPRRAMHYVDVLGARMAYVDEGISEAGKPVALLLHGNPTSSFLWRNVIPHLTPHIRCVAPDLIGFGYSDKPHIAYRVEDHARYLQAFIDALGLTDVVLILHDWGSALGLDWARRHSSQVRGLALMEFLPPMPTWLDLAHEPYELFKTIRDPENGRSMIVEQNAFIEHALPGGMMRTLSEAEMNEYRRPFPTPATREPLYRFPNELPIAGTPADTYAMAMAYHAWLLETETPKIFFHVTPGVFIPPSLARFYREKLKACYSVDLGQGSHYVQEDYPDEIGRGIAAWLPSPG